MTIVLTSLANLFIAILVVNFLSGPPDCRTIRSSGAKAQFKAEHPCPANGRRSGACGGYVIDHIVPLACGGADVPNNMQWQTTAEGKAKDKWERKACGK